MELAFSLRHVSEDNLHVSNQECLRPEQTQVLRRESVGVQVIDL